MFDTGNVKQRINAGEVTVGGWLSSNSLAIAEVMAAAGFDWVAVDVEHSPANESSMEAIAKAVKFRGVKPLARVFDSSACSIRRVLDAGMEGVIVPMIRSVEQAKAVVAAAKFPPIGMRGAGASACNTYGIDLGGEYVKKANEGTLVLLMVETREAVENIDALLEIDGIDGIFMGPFDLSASYGIVGKITDPIIQNAMDKVFASCRAHKKAAGFHVLPNDAAVIKTTMDKGANFIALSFDTNLIYTSSKDIIKTAKSCI